MINDGMNGLPELSMNPNLAKVSEDAKELMKRMLKVDPEWRMSVSETLSHPWFALPIRPYDGSGWRSCELPGRNPGPCCIVKRNSAPISGESRHDYLREISDIFLLAFAGLLPLDPGHIEKFLGFCISIPVSSFGMAQGEIKRSILICYTAAISTEVQTISMASSSRSTVPSRASESLQIPDSGSFKQKRKQHSESSQKFTMLCPSKLKNSVATIEKELRIPNELVRPSNNCKTNRLTAQPPSNTKMPK
jgi:serine/threonine protein kinase